MHNNRTVRTEISAPIHVVWNLWILPYHIKKWNSAHESWHTPSATNNFYVGGRFSYTMASVDGKHSFDFAGTYTKITEYKTIEHVLDDERSVRIDFENIDGKTVVTETFELETTNDPDMQVMGWQAILNHFQQYTEALLPELLQYERRLSATPEKLFTTIISKPSYEAWTSVFNPTSRFEGSWDEGSTILFLGTDASGNLGGMVAKIKEVIANAFISIFHLKEWKEGDTIDKDYVIPDTESLENYQLLPVENGTLLVVDMIGDFSQYKNYFDETWPKALEKLDQISTQHG